MKCDNKLAVTIPVFSNLQKPQSSSYFLMAASYTQDEWDDKSKTIFLATTGFIVG